MYRKITATIGLCLLLVVAASCSKDDAVQQQPAPSSIPKRTDLPADTAVVDVAVTKPATITSIDPALVPEKARHASAATWLSPEDKICIDDTIYETVKADPSIEATAGKLASVMGHAVVACAGADKVAAALSDGVKQNFGIDDTQAACMTNKLAADPDAAAELMGASATQEIAAIQKAIAPFESACNFKLAGQ